MATGKRQKRKTKLQEITDGLNIVNDLLNTTAPGFMDKLNDVLSRLISPGEQQLPPGGGPAPTAPAAKLSPYQVFGLSPNSPQDAFKKRYQDLMKIFHPDSGSTDDFMAKQVNLAWEAIRKEKGW